jgi:hypothetical protein
MEFLGKLRTTPVAVIARNVSSASGDSELVVGAILAMVKVPSKIVARRAVEAVR